jgi:hypothetical protein
VWQAVFEDHKDDDFMIIAVAQESRGLETAQEFIDEAGPTYVVLIDQEHVVSDLYNLTNVPQAVWIDENGKIIRPPETAGSHDGWRAMNREDMSMPDESAAIIAKAQETYMNALRDWARNGADSRFAFDEAAARAHLKKPADNTALAFANFHLGQYLYRNGKQDEGDKFLKTAINLKPESWTMYRQAMNLRDVGAMGFAADETYFARVDALGANRYYEPPDLEDFPTELGFEPPA